jgi:hypothetical protein
MKGYKPNIFMMLPWIYKRDENIILDLRYGGFLREKGMDNLDIRIDNVWNAGKLDDGDRIQPFKKMIGSEPIPFDQLYMDIKG